MLCNQAVIILDCCTFREMQHRHLLVTHGKAENQKSNIEKSQSNPKVNLDIEEGNPAAGLMQRPRMYLIHPATTAAWPQRMNSCWKL